MARSENDYGELLNGSQVHLCNNLWFLLRYKLILSIPTIYLRYKLFLSIPTSYVRYKLLISIPTIYVRYN